MHCKFCEQEIDQVPNSTLYFAVEVSRWGFGLSCETRSGEVFGHLPA